MNFFNSLSYRPPRINSDVYLYPSWAFKKDNMICMTQVVNDIIIGTDSEIFLYSPKEGNSVTILSSIKSPITAIISNGEKVMSKGKSSRLIYTIVTGHLNGTVSFWSYTPRAMGRTPVLSCNCTLLLRSESKVNYIISDDDITVVFASTESAELFVIDNSFSKSSINLQKNLNNAHPVQRLLFSSINIVSMALTRHNLWMVTNLGDLLVYSLPNSNSLIKILDGKVSPCYCITSDEDEQYEGVLCGCDDGKVASIESDGSVNWKILLLPKVIDRRVRMICKICSNHDENMLGISNTDRSISKNSQYISLKGKRDVVAVVVGEDLSLFFHKQEHGYSEYKNENVDTNSSQMINEIDTCIPQYNGEHIRQLINISVGLAVLSNNALNIYMRDDIIVYLKGLTLVGKLTGNSGSKDMSYNIQNSLYSHKLGDYNANNYVSSFNGLNIVPGVGISIRQLESQQQSQALNSSRTILPSMIPIVEPNAQNFGKTMYKNNDTTFVNGGTSKKEISNDRDILEKSEASSSYNDHNNIIKNGGDDEKEGVKLSYKKENNIKRSYNNSDTIKQEIQVPLLQYHKKSEGLDVLNFSGLSMPLKDQQVVNEEFNNKSVKEAKQDELNNIIPNLHNKVTKVKMYDKLSTENNINKEYDANMKEIVDSSTSNGENSIEQNFGRQNKETASESGAYNFKDVPNNDIIMWRNKINDENEQLKTKLIKKQNEELSTRITELEQKIINDSQIREEDLRKKIESYENKMRELEINKKDLEHKLEMFQKQSTGLKENLTRCISSVNKLCETIEMLNCSTSDKPSIPVRPSAPPSNILVSEDPASTASLYIVSRCGEAQNLLVLLGKILFSQQKNQQADQINKQEIEPSISTLLEVYKSLKNRHMKLLQDYNDLKTKHVLDAIWLEDQTRSRGLGAQGLTGLDKTELASSNLDETGNRNDKQNTETESAAQSNGRVSPPPQPSGCAPPAEVGDIC